jgi:hypothetical protein
LVLQKWFCQKREIPLVGTKDAMYLRS